MATERALGHEPRDVSAAKVGYDVESRDGRTGRLRFIEVKGRAGDAETVTVTHQEIRTAPSTSPTPSSSPSSGSGTAT